MILSKSFNGVSSIISRCVIIKTTFAHCIVAPIKALCSERFDDWQGKFGPLGLKCCELTGDSQLDDYFELQNANIVMTTPVRSYTCNQIFGYLSIG